MHRDRNIQIAFFLLVSLSALRARAGNMDGVITSEYPNRVLTLRHVYSGDRLRFRGDGTLEENAPVSAWTLDGQIEVREATIDRDLLTLKGRRIYQVYDANSGRFVDALTILDGYPDKQRKDLEKMLRKRQVEIQIEMPPNPDPKEIPEALHAVFLAAGESMAKVVPSYWQAYFDKLEGRPEKPRDVVALTHVKQGGMSAPQATSHADPEYSEPARRMKYQGDLVLSLVVDANGSASDIRLVRPLGMGLDEKAIDAVRTWKFVPAEKDGQPVPVAISVEVTFRLH